LTFRLKKPTSAYSRNVLIFADKPICRSEQKRIYGVARNEAAEILCEVDAYPPPDSFKWSFNNTAETFEMPQSDYRIHSSRASSLAYTPVKVRLLWEFYTADFFPLFIRPLFGTKLQMAFVVSAPHVQLQRDMANIKCLNLSNSFNYLSI
jgi:hypothetical protein